MLRTLVALILAAALPREAAAFARPLGPQAYCTPERIGVVAMLDATNIIRCDAPNTYIIVNGALLSQAQRNAVIGGTLPFSDAVKLANP